MADRPDPYVKKDPGDIIYSGDWNELQIKTKEDFRTHRHTGGDDGTQVPREGVAPNAVDGSLIANGTFSDSITFMPAPANTQIWQGIVFKSSSYASVMRYCRIEATNKYAISVDACQPAISNCRLIDNTTGGLFIKNTSLSVNNSFFKGNGIAGVWLEKANLTILNSIFSQNGTALYLSNKGDISSTLHPANKKFYKTDLVVVDD